MSVRALAGIVLGACFGLACAAGMSSAEAQSPKGVAKTGVVIVDSDVDLTTTVNNLKAAIAERGLRLFATIDHTKNAVGAGLELRPTTVLLFGNPEVGTKLMQARATVAIDLPQKMLVWQEDDSVRIAYNDPAWLGIRHDLEHPALAKISTLLATLARRGAAKTRGSATD